MRYQKRTSSFNWATPLVPVAFVLSGIAVFYAFRSADYYERRVDGLERRLVALERAPVAPAEPPHTVSISAADHHRIAAPSESESDAPSRELRTADDNDPTPEWQHLPTWVGEQYPRRLSEAAVALEVEEGLVLGLRMRGPQGQMVALAGEEREAAEELLTLLSDFQSAREQFLLDAVYERRFVEVFGSREEAKEFTRTHRDHVIEETDDGQYGVVDLTPFNESEEIVGNGERRYQIAGQLNARLSTMISFERRLR